VTSVVGGRGDLPPAIDSKIAVAPFGRLVGACANSRSVRALGARFRRVVFSDRLVLVARFRISFWIIFLRSIRLRLQILGARNLSASLIDVKSVA